MADGVKFIFKTLIKVPVIIFAAFFVMNIFAFFFIYFKLLGLSYVVMQETVDKNYIADRQMGQLQKTLAELDAIGFVVDGSSGVVVGVDSAGNDVYVNSSGAPVGTLDSASPYGNARSKCQYGAVRHVGIRVSYKMIWPLDSSVVKGSTDPGGRGMENYNAIDESTGEVKGIIIPITITYNVPGLKYYADI